MLRAAAGFGCRGTPCWYATRCMRATAPRLPVAALMVPVLPQLQMSNTAACITRHVRSQLINTDDTRLFQPVDIDADWALAAVLPG